MLSVGQVGDANGPAAPSAEDEENAEVAGTNAEDPLIARDVEAAADANASSPLTKDEFATERECLKYINNLMSSILRVKTIVKLRDKHLARLIVHAFYRRQP
ncbi:unnamed protein product, partial [Mesorhabditis belari]|uniref:Uncharacterized protein n=1 Tax=Mesorhabditis belari TaxID=2138241 RepID=A0AAF3FCW9_9BILA